MATTDKYDRQIRLWGAHGQRKLAETRLLLVGAEPAGVETIKNLILPGIGFVAILDHENVTERDLGNNFFVETSRLGQNRAKTTLDMLLEMNPDVQGEAIPENVFTLLNSNPAFFTKFNMIILNEQRDHILQGIASIAAQKNINLLSVRTYGLIGTLRLMGNQHTIIESKPSDRDLDDLRLCTPFPELLQFAQSFDLKSLDAKAHKHIPYVVILIQTLLEWRESHNGNPPTNFTEKQAFKQTVKEKSRDFYQEENFGEAFKNAHKAYADPNNLTEETLAVLEHPNCVNADKTSSNFWIFVKALKKFMQIHGYPPLKYQSAVISSLMIVQGFNSRYDS
eukprot:TRINITY_DN2548_c0_g2_i5.p1 TRINITY_DN2548_c0_g2~~TRINITY_DN2548_c0_g2_i5.p1  ORF type:complete len:337 (-),score=36.18 TRINITY_DN2548_c0_g2_i5:634-1644(-)